MKKKPNLTFREDIQESTDKLQSYGITKLYAYYFLYLDKLEKHLQREFDDNEKQKLFDIIKEQTSVDDIINKICEISEEW